MLLEKFDEVGYVLLVMPFSNVLCNQYACHVCRTVTLRVSLRRIIDPPFDGTSVAAIE